MAPSPGRPEPFKWRPLRLDLLLLKIFGPPRLRKQPFRQAKEGGLVHILLNESNLSDMVAWLYKLKPLASPIC